MILKDVIDNLGLTTIPYIMYYTTCEDENIFTGCCRYENGELISLDADYYALDDEVDSFDLERNEVDGKFTLVVYYKSCWLDGESNEYKFYDLVEQGKYTELIDVK